MKDSKSNGASLPTSPSSSDDAAAVAETFSVECVVEQASLLSLDNDSSAKKSPGDGAMPPSPEEEEAAAVFIHTPGGENNSSRLTIKKNVSFGSAKKLVPKRILSHDDLSKALSENIPGLHVDPELVDTTPLHDAAEDDDEPLVRALLVLKPKLETRNSDGETALHCAASFGSSGSLHLLLEAGADANARNEDEETALHEAAREGDVEACKILLRHGADVDATDDGEHTPLHLASLAGHVEVVKVLLEYGAEALTKDDGGNTAMHLASYKGHVEVVQTLLESRPDLLRARSANDLTSLDLSESRGHDNIGKMLRSASQKQFDQGNW